MTFFAILGLALILLAFHLIPGKSKTYTSAGQINGLKDWWSVPGAGTPNNSWNNFHSGSGSFKSNSGAGGNGFGGFGEGRFGGGGASGSW
ncbi:MAG: hypothetical protein R2764_08970 [Bacteroidales bacterium]